MTTSHDNSPQAWLLRRLALLGSAEARLGKRINVATIREARRKLEAQIAASDERQVRFDV